MTPAAPRTFGGRTRRAGGALAWAVLGAVANATRRIGFFRDQLAAALRGEEGGLACTAAFSLLGGRKPALLVRPDEAPPARRPEGRLEVGRAQRRVVVLLQNRIVENGRTGRR